MKARIMSIKATIHLRDLLGSASGTDLQAAETAATISDLDFGSAISAYPDDIFGIHLFLSKLALSLKISLKPEQTLMNFTKSNLLQSHYRTTEFKIKGGKQTGGKIWRGFFESFKKIIDYSVGVSFPVSSGTGTFCSEKD